MEDLWPIMGPPASLLSHDFLSEPCSPPRSFISGSKAESKVIGRKAMTNLDGILKSRDITSPTKVRIVKAI